MNNFSCIIKKLLLSKVKLKMKLSILFLLLALLKVNANVYSQDTKISIDIKDKTIEEVFNQIKNQSKYNILFKNSEIDLNRKITIKVKKKTIGKILNIVLNKTDITYEVIGKQIVLKRQRSLKNPAESFQQASKIITEVQQIIKGSVVDQLGVPLAGVNILVKGTTRGAQTDFDGNYSINASAGEVLVFSFVGMKTIEITVGNNSTVNLNMEEDSAALDEVVIVGFGSQKKESVVGAISSVKPSELKIPSSNLTTALAGRVSGIVSYQTSGEPGADNAQFFVRGVASFNNQNGPLILIDGVELSVDDLARLQPDDIAEFSVLKDPTTTAIYGSRGANGIILVTTKTGVNAKPVVNLRIENSYSAPVSLVRLADPITHMILQNEAERTRGRFPTFTEEKIAGTIRGGNPNIYPAVDWYDELFNDFSITQRVNLNVRGGGEKVRYYVAGSFSKDNGLLRVEKTNNFTNNIDLKRYLLRSNVNMDLHENTELIVRLHTTVDNYVGPLQGGNAIYNSAVRTSPVRFPAVYDPDPSLANVPHVTFGNDFGPRFGNQDDGAAWFNPYAELQRGYRDYKRQLSLVQFELKQDLGSILPGLTGRFLGNINTTSFFENRRAYTPFFYRLQSSDAITGEYSLERTAEGDEALQFQSGEEINNTVFYVETALNYAKTFEEKHDITGLLVFTAREFTESNAGSLQLSLPSRNITLAGRYNYSYDKRYFAEFNFGYNGSERFAKNNRFGFFPSFGAGWLISNESFFKSSVINRLKLRASFGWVGNDRIGNTRDDRFFYLSEVNTSDPTRGASFGSNFNTNIPGVSISRYENTRVTWETSRKVNLGIDVNLFDSAIQFRADVFEDLRSNILQVRSDIPSTLGLQAIPQTNVGKVLARGVDASIDINHSFSNDFWITGRATFVYSDNEFKEFEEPNFAALNSPSRSFIGKNVNVSHGLIAERLFVDDAEALNAPRQFGTPGVDYGGGDIKYKDINGDGTITDLDRVPIGKPTVPKVTYGFGFSLGYKKFDLNMFFQGLSETSFYINPATTGPFVNSLSGNGFNPSAFGENGALSENGLLKAYADSHWSEDNKDVFALWPRLSTTIIENNNQTSTWWLRDGAFLRLKQVELGFTLIDGSNDNGLISKLRFYATGTNLVEWSKFKLWDPELAGNGLNYPLQRVINFGVHIAF